MPLSFVAYFVIVQAVAGSLDRYSPLISDRSRCSYQENGQIKTVEPGRLNRVKTSKDASIAYSCGKDGIWEKANSARTDPIGQTLACTFRIAGGETWTGLHDSSEFLDEMGQVKTCDRGSIGVSNSEDLAKQDLSCRFLTDLNEMEENIGKRIIAVRSKFLNKEESRNQELLNLLGHWRDYQNAMSRLLPFHLQKVRARGPCLSGEEIEESLRTKYRNGPKHEGALKSFLNLAAKELASGKNRALQGQLERAIDELGSKSTPSIPQQNSKSPAR